MFGREQPSVITEEEVGDFIAELNNHQQPLEEILHDLHEQGPVVIGRKAATTRS